MTFLTLDRCQGPECPKCGCCDAEILKEPDPGLGVTTWYGSGMARCKHCRATFHFKPDDEPAASTDSAWPDPASQESGVRSQEPAESTAESGEIAVPYVRMRCPLCKSPKLRVTSTRGPIRWHRCGECEHKFKSFERQE